MSLPPFSHSEQAEDLPIKVPIYSIDLNNTRSGKELARIDSSDETIYKLYETLLANFYGSGIVTLLEYLPSY